MLSKKLVASFILASSMAAGIVPGMSAVANAVEVTEENLPKLLEKLFRERPGTGHGCAAQAKRICT